MKADLTLLTKEEEETLKQTLFDFVIRVSSHKKDREDIEIKILPEMISFLLNYFIAD
ncbi:MAG: hypothetical protein IJ597_05350 [Synergistaceae bacterium]|nr:hypothetical protein [Synergistaceae bacterium]